MDVLAQEISSGASVHLPLQNPALLPSTWLHLSPSYLSLLISQRRVRVLGRRFINQSNAKESENERYDQKKPAIQCRSVLNELVPISIPDDPFMDPYPSDGVFPAEMHIRQSLFTGIIIYLIYLALGHWILDRLAKIPTSDLHAAASYAGGHTRAVHLNLLLFTQTKMQQIGQEYGIRVQVQQSLPDNPPSKQL